MNKYVTVVFHVPQKYGSQSDFHILFHILSRVWKAPVMILYAWKKKAKISFWYARAIWTLYIYDAEVFKTKQNQK